MNMKTIFKSKTAAAAFITSLAGVVATFVPSVGDWVANNASSLLVALGVLNVILRAVTKEKVTLF